MRSKRSGTRWSAQATLPTGCRMTSDDMSAHADGGELLQRIIAFINGEVLGSSSGMAPRACLFFFAVGTSVRFMTRDYSPARLVLWGRQALITPRTRSSPAATAHTRFQVARRPDSLPSQHLLEILVADTQVRARSTKMNSAGACQRLPGLRRSTSASSFVSPLCQHRCLS